MRVHVSIHDVSPSFRPEIELALELSRVAGAKPALLVVPHFHGRALLTEDGDFCSWLRTLQAEGHEVLLHGFLHLSQSEEDLGHAEWDGPPRGLRRYFAQHVVSAQEAEFSDVSRREAQKRLDAGERVLSDAGLRIDGFVPPAWSMPSWMLPLLAARGCRFTEDRLTVYDPAGSRRRPSLLLNYATRTPPRLLSTVGFCRVATPLAAFVPARIAIHPSDMRFALIRKELARLLAWGNSGPRRFVQRARGLLD